MVNSLRIDTLQSMTVKDIFIHLASRVSEEPYWREVSLRVRFVIEGEESQAWILDTTTASPRLIPSDGITHCTITMSSETLRALMAGTLNPQRACIDGRLSVDGEAEDALKTWRLFPLPESAESMPQLVQ